MKLGLITGFLSQTQDRFSKYNAPKTLEEKFQMMNQIEGFDGVEIVYPYEVNDVEETKRLLKKYNLNIAAINCNIKGEPEFINGSLTSKDELTRKKAVELIKKAKDFAIAVGADKVQCCPLSDGYEFSFQYDYRDTWKFLKETLKEAAEYKNEMPLFIEYKPSEIRGRCFLNSAAKTITLIKEIGVKNLGITLDFGHSIYGNENPAEALCLIAENNIPYYIHINDNDGKWDWDFFCGSHNYIQYIEFLYYLKRYGYNDYLTSDTSPTRWDIIRTFETNGRLTKKIWDAFDRIDIVQLEDMIKNGESLKTWEEIENLFYVKL
jgi:xylose isomerase